MSGKMSSIKGQVALLRPDTLVSRAGQRTAVVFGVVRCVQNSGRVLGEALLSVPGHVLDGEKGAVGAEEEIEISRPDDGVVGVFDDALENTGVGWALGSVTSIAGVVAQSEYVLAATLLPVGSGNSVKCLCDVRTIEVDLGARRLVVAFVDYPQLRERVGAGFGDVVDVEAWVHLQNSGVQALEHSAVAILGIVRGLENGGCFLGCGKCEVLLEICVITTFMLALTGSVHKALVQVQQILPVLDVW